MRAAVGFVIIIAYLQILARVLQFIGAVLKKRLLSRIGYGISTVLIVVLFFGAMVDENHKSTI